MFKNTFQSGLLSIFYSCGSNPLSLWDSNVKNGHIKRLTDKEINSLVLELVSTNVTTTYITCPRNNGVLGIKLPFLVVVLKNMKRYFSFEIVILDDKNLRRRFKVSNFQSTTKVKPFCTSMPVGLSDGWNQIQFNLSDFTQRAYGTQYIEALQVEVHANTRLRRIYFSDRLYTEEELPQEYKLFLPLTEKGKRGKDIKKDEKADKDKPPPAEGEKNTASKNVPVAKVEAAPTEAGEPVIKAAEAPPENSAEVTDEPPAEVKDEPPMEVAENPENVVENVEENVEGNVEENVEGNVEENVEGNVEENFEEVAENPGEPDLEETAA